MLSVTGYGLTHFLDVLVLHSDDGSDNIVVVVLNLGFFIFRTESMIKKNLI